MQDRTRSIFCEECNTSRRAVGRRAEYNCEKCGESTFHSCATQEFSMPVREKVLAWHFVTRREYRSQNGQLLDLGFRLTKSASHLEAEAGYIYSINAAEYPNLCSCGMHGSIKARDAFSYVPETNTRNGVLTNVMVCRVWIWGDIAESSDKLCGRHREIIWTANLNRLKNPHIVREMGALDFEKVMLSLAPKWWKEPKEKRVKY